jgi:hypothetical protein
MRAAVLPDDFAKKLWRPGWQARATSLRRSPQTCAASLSSPLLASAAYSPLICHDCAAACHPATAAPARRHATMCRLRRAHRAACLCLFHDTKAFFAFCFPVGASARIPFVDAASRTRIAGFCA